MTVEVPDVMVDDKVEEIIRNYAANFGMTDRSVSIDKLKEMMGLNDEILNAGIRPGALLQVKSDLLVEAVAKAEDIQVSEEEINEYAEKIAKSVEGKPEEIKEYFGEEFITSEKRKEKATALIFDTAVATEPKEEEKAE